MAEVSFERVKQLLGEVRRRDPGEREAWLEQACGADVRLRDEVLALLREGERDTGFMEQPAEALEGLLQTTLADVQQGASMPPNVGAFKILRVLGTGGMGAVYEAEQEHPRRRVALKMIRPGLASDEVVRRFHREAGMLGRLHHPGIAQIYDAGVVDLGSGEQPYFAMELVEGLPLTKFVEAKQLDTRARLQLFARVCDAVQHAHQNGVVHRDLKPDNILVTESASTVSAGSNVEGTVGQPKVLDFGVARSIEVDAQLVTLQTSTGQLVGTLPYMSPEQVAGDGRAVDARSDVYALGVLLFELLTRRLPHDLAGRSIPDAARVIQDDEPRRLASVDTAFRGDLETIVAKALEKDPERRYASAAELGADALRHLHHEPISARPASMLYQLRKFASRNRALVGGVAIAFAALVAGLVVSIRYGLSEAEQRALADLRAADARFSAYQAGLAAAQSSSDPLAVSEDLQRAPPEFRGWEHGHLLARSDPMVWDLVVADAASDPARGAVAHDAAGLPLYVYASTDGLARVELASERRDLVIAGLLGVDLLALSADGGVLAAVSSDPPRLEVWQLQGTPPSARSSLRRELAGACEALALSADGSRVAVHERDTGVAVLDVAGGAELYRFDGEVPRPSLSLSADGAWLAVGAHGKGLRLVSASGSEKLYYRSSLVALAPSAESVAFSAERGLLVQALGPDREPVAVGGFNSAPACLSLASGGARLLIGRDRRIEAWDARTGRYELGFALSDRKLLRHSEPRLGARGNSLVAATTTGARAWDLGHVGERVLGGEDPLRYLYEAAFSPDGRLLAAGGARRQLRLWDVSSGELLAVLPSEFKVIESIAFADDGARVMAMKGKDVEVWDTALGAQSRERLEADAEGGPPWAREGAPRAWWRLADGAARTTTRPGFKQSRVSSADHALGVLGTGGGFELRDASTGGVVLLADLEGVELPGDELPAVALSPRGELVVTGHRDGVLRLWSATTGRLQAELAGHTGQIYSLAFNPDGTRLVSGSRDGTLRVWHVERRASLLVLQGHDDYVHAVSFSPDGTWIASASGDGSVRLWDSLPVAERARRAREDARAREAMRLRVRELLEQLPDAASVAARLREDAALSELERSAALRELLRELAAEPQRPPR